jgi:ATP-dependent RNA helicase DDX54/DBP10
VQVDAAEQTLAAFTEHLKAFRPKQTVLETEGAAAKGARQETLVVTMLAKRAAHEHLIDAARHKESDQHGGAAGGEDEVSATLVRFSNR